MMERADQQYCVECIFEEGQFVCIAKNQGAWGSIEEKPFSIQVDALYPLLSDNLSSHISGSCPNVEKPCARENEVKKLYYYATGPTPNDPSEKHPIGQPAQNILHQDKETIYAFHLM